MGLTSHVTNKIIIKYIFLIHSLDNMLNLISRAKLFFQIELKDSFYNIKI